MDNIKNPAKKPKLKKSYSNSTIFQKLMVDDVRNKILFTILCLLINRLGCGITIPFVNTAALQTMFGSTSVSCHGCCSIGSRYHLTKINTIIRKENVSSNSYKRLLDEAEAQMPSEEFEKF